MLQNIYYINQPVIHYIDNKENAMATKDDLKDFVDEVCDNAKDIIKKEFANR